MLSIELGMGEQIRFAVECISDREQHPGMLEHGVLIPVGAFRDLIRLADRGELLLQFRLEKALQKTLVPGSGDNQGRNRQYEDAEVDVVKCTAKALGGLEAEVKGFFDAQEWAEEPFFPPEEDAAFMPFGEFKRLMRTILPAISTDNHRPVLTHAYVDGDLLLATDTHRLAVMKVPALGGSTRILNNAPARFLSGKAIEAILKLKLKDTQFIRIHQDGISAGSFEYRSARYGGNSGKVEYPNWRRVVPEPGRTQAFNRAALIHIFSRLYPIASENANRILMTQAEGGGVVFSAKTDAFGVVSISLEGEGQICDTAFNASYVLDYLRSISSENVWLSQAEGGKPCIFADNEELSYQTGTICVIMPMVRS